MRKILAFTVALAVFTAAVSCSKGIGSSSSSRTDSAEIPTAAQTAYTGTELKTPEDLSAPEFISPDDEGGFRFIYTDTAFDLKMAVYDSEFGLTDTLKIMNCGNGSAAVYCASDGSISVLICTNEHASPEDYEGKCVEMHLLSFDSSGKKTSDIEVPNIGTYLTSAFSPMTLVPYEDGFIAGNLHTAISLDSSGALTGAVSTGNGTFLSSGSELFYFGNEGWALTDGLLVPSGLNSYGFYQSTNVTGLPSAGDQGLIVKLDKGIFCVDNDGKLVKELDFETSALLSSEISLSSRLNDGKIVSFVYGAEPHLELFEPKPEGYDDGREEIVVGLLGSDITGDQYVALYNQNSDRYSASVRRYSIENGDEQLREDIISGDAPDVCQMSSPEMMYNLVNAGALADLGELSGKYSGISLDDLMPNILEAMTYKGKVWAMPMSYTLSALIADRSVISREDSGWDMERFLEIAGNMPEGMQLAEKYSFYERSDLFDALCTSSLYNWVDYENCTCKFDSPEFIRFLEFCRDVPMTASSEFLNDITDAERAVIAAENAAALRNREALLSCARYIMKLDSFNSIAAMCTFEMNEVTLLPMPSPDGKGAVSPNSTYAVCRNGFTEGAWNYLSFLFSSENQTFDPSASMVAAPIMEFPVRKDAFEAMKNRNQSTDVIGGSNYNGFEVSYPMKLKPEDLKYACEYIGCCSHLSTNTCPAAEIASEEFLKFNGGEQTAEQCAKMIQNRVSLYLAENK